MVETDNVLPAFAALALDANQFAGVDVVAVLGRVGASVAAARGRGYDAGAIIMEAAEQPGGAFVRIGLFAVAAEGSVVCMRQFQHDGNGEVRSQNAEVNPSSLRRFTSDFSLLTSAFLSSLRPESLPQVCFDRVAENCDNYRVLVLP